MFPPMLSTIGLRGARAALVLAVLAGCSGDDEPAGPRLWDSCELTGDACSCVIREGGSTQEYPPADRCGGFNCCLLSESATGSSASCTCSDLSEACEDVAESAGMTVVTQCPPPGELLSSRAMCVPEGQRCPNRMTDDASGCCEGLLCLSNGDDDDSFPICRAGGAGDPDLELQCERATLLKQDNVEVTSGSLATSRGDLRFDDALFGTARVGAGGCLTELTIEFSGPAAGGGEPDGGDASCTLLLDASLRDGEWEVRRVLGSLEACEGYSGDGGGSFDERDRSLIPFGFSYVGEYCGARHAFGENCVAGDFEWELTGELAGITFEGSRLKATGVICGTPDDVACE